MKKENVMKNEEGSAPSAPSAPSASPLQQSQQSAQVPSLLGSRSQSVSSSDGDTCLESNKKSKKNFSANLGRHKNKIAGILAAGAFIGGGVVAAVGDPKFFNAHDVFSPSPEGYAVIGLLAASIVFMGVYLFVNWSTKPDPKTAPLCEESGKKPGFLRGIYSRLFIQPASKVVGSETLGGGVGSHSFSVGTGGKASFGQNQNTTPEYAYDG